MSFKPKTNLAALFVLLLAGILTGLLIFDKPKKEIVKNSNQTVLPTPTPTPSASPTITTPLPTLPKVFGLKVPFTPQAPTANWDELHNEACEEASMIMAHAYFSNMTDSVLKPEFVEDEITKLTEWEKNNFGYYLDINAEETVKVLKEVYGLKAQVITNFTEEQIKRELYDNKLVFILANGQKLGNPNFRRPGPPYHMLVVRGWDNQGFITNDPGTRKGQNYPYAFETLYNAGGDWDHEIHGVDESIKKAIVVWE